MKTDRDFALRAIELALKLGAREAEIYSVSSRLVSAEVCSGEVTAVEGAVTGGYGLRVLARGGMGFSYSTEPEEVEGVASAALSAAEHSEHEVLPELPGAPAPREAEIYDSAVAALGEEDAVEMALRIERATLAKDARVRKTRKTTASFSSSKTIICNSRGLVHEHAGTSLSGHLMSVAEEGADSQTGWGYGASRFLKDVDFERIGTEAAERAVALLGARRISAIKAPVVLDNHVTAEFLSVFSSMLSSENVQKGRSLLKGRVGQKVISDIASVIDDGLMPRALGTRPVDDEGVPTATKELIGAGVLRGFMYNSYTAAKEGVKSTGNARRGGFVSTPSVGPTNLYLRAGTPGIPLKELIRATGSGLYVMDAMGMHTANPITGEFSIGVSGIWIEGGEEAYPVKEAVISGDLLEFFSGLSGVGDDLRFFGSIGAPSIMVESVSISA